METKEIKELKQRIKSLENTVKSTWKMLLIANGIIDKSEERIKSLEEIVTQQSNSNTQILIKLTKLDEYNEELSERIKSLEGGCKCKGNDNTELDHLRKENKKLKQVVKDLKLQIRLNNLYSQYESGEISREQYDKYIEFLKYL